MNKQMMSNTNGIVSKLSKEKLQAKLLVLGLFSAAMYLNTQVSAQKFATVQTNPFSITGLGNGNWSAPGFADFDNDGDLDMLSGNSGLAEHFAYYENTGTVTTPEFGAVQNNPFGLANLVEGIPSIALGDLDGDGDVDVFATDGSSLDFFQNTGTKESPAFATVQHGAFGLKVPASAFIFYNPTLADLDNDGDLDLMIGDYYGPFFYFENTGTATAPAFSAAQTNPFNLSASSLSSPAFGDLDGDGDYDIISSENSGTGNLYFYENTGTKTSPDFSSGQENPFSLTAIGGNVVEPTIVDLDGDGDLDILLGDNTGDFHYFENTTGVSGVLNVKPQSELRIYPNPVDGQLNIDVSDMGSGVAFSIHSIDGKEMLAVSQALNGTIQVNTTLFPSGVYFVQVTNSIRTETLKFVKN